MSASEPAPIAIASSDGRLRVQFEWREDRFVQQMILDQVQSGESFEGDAQDTWPPSPPLQQLSLEQINQSPAILGVGAAGRGHWSISVEVEDHSPSALRFELACRCKESADFLGSTYRLVEDLIIEPVDGLVDEHEPDFDEDPKGCRRITIRPTELDTPTRRWSYRIQPKLGSLGR